MSNYIAWFKKEFLPFLIVRLLTVWNNFHTPYWTWNLLETFVFKMRKYTEFSRGLILYHRESSLLTLGCGCVPQSACCYKHTPHGNNVEIFKWYLTLYTPTASVNLNFCCRPTLLPGHVIANEKIRFSLPKFFTETVIFGWKMKGEEHQTTGWKVVCKPVQCCVSLKVQFMKFRLLV